MIFNAIQSNRYDIDLINPLKNSQRLIKQRQGIIVQLMLDNQCGCGDAAPLLPYSNESLTEISWALEELKIALKHNSNYTKNDLLNLFSLYAQSVPALHYALDMSLYDILARKEKLPLATYLNSSNLDCVSFSFLYNGEINQSFKTIKVKFGISSIDDDIQLLNNLYHKYNHDVIFRIDANQAYDIEVFLDLIQKIKQYNIQYIEEPLSSLDIHSLKIIKDQCDIPIAIDETIFQENYKELIESKLLDYVILKPSIYGGLKSIFEFYDYVKEYNLKIVLSSALNSVIGNLADIHLASALQLPYDHGLNNYALIKAYQGLAPYNENDSMIMINDLLGLGVCIND